MMIRFPVATLVMTVAAAAVLSSQDWTQWRGPQGAAVASTFKPPASWPDEPKLAWKAPGAGIGHASPVVSGTRVFLFSRVGEQEALTAYDLASGKQLWRQAYDAPYEMNPAARGHGKGPKGTPLFHGARVFTFGISGILSAFNAADGKVVWRKDFKGQHPVTSPDFGAAVSPIAVSDAIVVHVGGPKGGAITAFDAATGAARWSWKGDGPGYATPIVATFGGTRQLITQSQSNVVGIDAAKGSLLWQIPFTTAYDQNIITAVVSDALMIYSGLSKPTTAVRVTQAGGKWMTEEVWKNPDVPMYMSSPVAGAGRLCGLTHRNRGQFFCLDVASGKTLWTSDPRQGENAGIFAAGGLFIAATTDGNVIVFRNSAAAFDVVKQYKVAESPVWAHPVPAGRGILIKDADSLAYWTF
jgi:outer membrane protein assembly factor BamB